MSQDPFTATTAELLAKRAAFHCSRPGCGAPTIGPSETEPDKSRSVGVAAHITASSPKGPRYDAALTSEQRRHADNGIWLCQTCSRLIDTNEGKDFPEKMLREWKAEHEAANMSSIGKPKKDELHELAGKIQARGVGEVIGADIRRPTRIQPGTEIEATGIGRVIGVKIGG